MNKLLNLFTEYVIGEQEKYTKPITYIMAKNGIFERRENAIGIFFKQVADGEVKGLEELSEKFVFKLPKIPENILQKIINFFKWVNEKYSAEAMIHIYFSKSKQEYFIDCPEQKITAAHVSFTKSVDIEKNPDNILVMDIHSHNTMDAFFSGTDDKDEQEDRIYGVIGHITNTLPAIKTRVCTSGRPVGNITIHDIFEIPTDFPIEWKERISKPIYNSTFWSEQQSDNAWLYGDKITPKEEKKKSQTEIDNIHIDMICKYADDNMTNEDIQNLIEETKLLYQESFGHGDNNAQETRFH